MAGDIEAVDEDNYNHRTQVYINVGVGIVLLIAVVGAWVEVNREIASISSEIRPLTTLQGSVNTLATIVAGHTEQIRNNSQNIADLRTTSVLTGNSIGTMRDTLTEIKTEIHDKFDFGGKRK